MVGNNYNHNAGIDCVASTLQATSLLRLVMEEVDRTHTTTEHLIQTMETAQDRLVPLLDIDMTNQEILQDILPLLTQERAVELLQGMLVLLDLASPGTPSLEDQIDNVKAKLHTLKVVSTHLHTALDGLELK